MRVIVVTHFGSPYQIELFNSLAKAGSFELEVVYLHQYLYARPWKQMRIVHEHVFLDDKHRSFAEVRSRVLRSDLVIFNYYAENPAQVLLNLRAAKGSPWCFWGERPGFRKPEWLGQAFRRWRLRKLHGSRAPIWGIGQFAVERYKTEFGLQRAYYNVPYFSDLERFKKVAAAAGKPAYRRVFLFSGALIHRKGVDLLAQAFVELARELPNVFLRVVGDGPLRKLVMELLDVVRDRVEFIGFTDWDELPSYYSEADVLCVPSRYDGWGMVVPEGLAAGLPVIGTDQTGAALEFLKAETNGWLIPAGNSDALLSAMREAAQLPAKNYERLAECAGASVSGHSLGDGARRFVKCACETVATWQ